MNSDEKSRRIRERVKLQLPVRVKCRETVTYEWQEVTRLLDVTPFGASLTLGRPTETGRLLHLTTSMPRQLRCFDHVEDQYLVWALVRRVQPFAPPPSSSPQKGAGASRFEVGVAFIGKHPPLSFTADPSTRYEITALSTANNQWALREKTVTAAPVGSVSPRSQDTRLSMPIEVIVEVLDEKGAVKMSEQTVTENISRRDAAVWTTLPVERGRFVRLTSARYQLSVNAAVRARRMGADGLPRLHLEFIGENWPLEGIE